MSIPRELQSANRTLVGTPHLSEQFLRRLLGCFCPRLANSSAKAAGYAFIDEPLLRLLEGSLSKTALMTLVGLFAIGTVMFI